MQRAVEARVVSTRSDRCPTTFVLDVRAEDEFEVGAALYALGVLLAVKFVFTRVSIVVK